MTRIVPILWLAFAGPALADTVVAAHTLRAQTIVTAADLAFEPGEIAGGTSDPNELIGMETRVAIYAGRPVRPGDVGPPAIIERNQIIPLL